MTHWKEKIANKFRFSKYFRAARALGFAARHPYLALRSVDTPARIQWEGKARTKGKSLPQITSDELLQGHSTCVVKPSICRNGNVSPYELMMIAALAAHFQPKNALEIGTFDGNTTLQIAANLPPQGVIHTIDLPADSTTTKIPLIKGERLFVTDLSKQRRKYVGTPEEKAIRQHFGDSAQYDFSHFTKERPLDFCFIDGSHSYEGVKSDTQNVLPLLSDNAVVLWHDFTSCWPGVYAYLCELGRSLPLYQIQDTTLAIFLKGSYIHT